MTNTSKRNEDQISAPRLTNREIAESIATNHSMTWLLEVESIERLLDTKDRERDEAVAEAVRRERMRIASELRKVWSFDKYQQHTHSWHTKEDFIEKLTTPPKQTQHDDTK